jgi:MOSC domain-containing protein YiiM
MTAKILSVNVSTPKEVEFQGQKVITGIFKEPVEGRIKLRHLNLEGDKQADLTVHGGPDKAVYAYPLEHYEFWRKIYPHTRMPYGMFGENFTILGLLENEVNVGDCFRMGTSKVIATQPRMPCYKLGVKFGNMDILRKFLASGRSGIYFKVLEEGEVGAGDSIIKLRNDPHGVTISDIVRIYAMDKEDIDMMRCALRVKDLPKGWRSYFLDQIRLIEKKQKKSKYPKM